MMAIGNQTMTFLNYIAFFLAGALMANGVPHFVKGICGEKFVTPFARLFENKAASSALVNVVWGFFNFAVGALLLNHFTPVRIPPMMEPCVTAAFGALVCAVYLAWRFSQVKKVGKVRKVAKKKRKG